MSITIIGLGVNEGDITLNALNELKSGKKIILKTELAKSANSVKSLNLKYTTLDEVYEKSRNFNNLNQNLAKSVITFAKNEDILYCVDGAVSEDNSAKIILSKVKDVKIINGVSKITNFLAYANMNTCNYFAVSAYELDFLREVDSSLVVYDIDSEILSSEIKLKLIDLIGEEEEILFISQNEAKYIKVFELDRQKNYDYTTGIVYNNKDFLHKKRFNFNDLMEIINKLRGENGCPWDRAQTNESIRINLIEEAYELVDAIDLKDDDKILEEIGDNLLQSAFHTVMKEEQGAFTNCDVVSNLCQKLITRHTHIFGEDKAKDAVEALNFWDNNKKKEKSQITYSDSVKDVPKNFPACLRAQKAQKRAGKSGFDFADVNSALKKVDEEFSELKEAILSKDKKSISNELGDLLFSVINIARFCDADAETSLKESTEKFIKRFCETERLILEDKKDIKKLSEKEIDEYYIKAKNSL